MRSALPPEAPITVLLERCANGDKDALNELVSALYPELKRIARGYMRRENSTHTLQPTALVHEAYARLIKQDLPDFRCRAHFMGVAAQIMRQVLIDHARARNSAKRGGGAIATTLSGLAADQSPPILDVDHALCRLSQSDSLKGKLIEMRFFGGLTAEESAEVLNLPVLTVRRQLRVAQAWLERELSSGRDTARAAVRHAG
jgi:RNA polymerase sigma factor (TIGR02999 family)